LPGRSVRLHDYIREYLEGILPGRALVHGRLVDAWKGGRQLPAGYAVQRIVFHLVESLADTSRVVERGKQLIDLLTNGSKSTCAAPFALELEDVLSRIEPHAGDAANLIELVLQQPEVPAQVRAVALRH
jgi:hypothetical protein